MTRTKLLNIRTKEILITTEGFWLRHTPHLSCVSFFFTERYIVALKLAKKTDENYDMDRCHSLFFLGGGEGMFCSLKPLYIFDICIFWLGLTLSRAGGGGGVDLFWES